MIANPAFERVGVAALLTGAAAKLALFLLWRGDANATVFALMAGSGISDRKTFYDARRQLELLGIYDDPRRLLGGWGEIPQVGDNPPGEGISPRGKIPQVRDNPPPPALRLRGQMTATVTPAADDIPEPANTRESMQALDLLDGSGLPSVGNSPFNVKRRAQVEALRAAWLDLIGQPIGVDEVKRALVRAENCAEDVYDAMERTKAACDTKDIQHPVAYFRKVMDGRDQRVAPPAPGAAPRNGSTYRPEPVDAGALTEPSAEWFAKVERLKKLKAKRDAEAKARGEPEWED